MFRLCPPRPKCACRFARWKQPSARDLAAHALPWGVEAALLTTISGLEQKQQVAEHRVGIPHIAGEGRSTTAHCVSFFWDSLVAKDKFYNCKGATVHTERCKTACLAQAGTPVRQTGLYSLQRLLCVQFRLLVFLPCARCATPHPMHKLGFTAGRQNLCIQQAP